MQPLDLIPLWAFFSLTILISFASIEVGYRFSKHRHIRNLREDESSINTMIGSALGLLAFMLAFTFGVAAARFDDRRTLLLDEANAIGTTFMRADLIPEPHDAKAKEILRQYVALRTNNVNIDLKGIRQAIATSVSLQEQLWAEAVAAGKENASDVTALFVQSVNDVIELQAKRINVGLRSRVPESIWAVLFILAALSMGGVGYQCGYSEKRSLPGSIILVVSFSMVIYLIADLDRPREGFVNVNQEPMFDLAKKIGSPGKL
jgi:hypothetical protein